ncbi:transposase [Pectinatus frisingensis]|uniref:transposase n=2 Tax=Pectinatus frisingensis TaxID=865 RepID=UPI003D807970
MVKKCLSRMSGKLSRTVLRRGKGSNPFSLVDYVSAEYRKATKKIQTSYSKKAYPWDNACIESFHSLIKREWLNRFKIIDYDHAYKLVFEYIETFYNTVRIHSYCGYKSPNQYEQEYFLQQKRCTLDLVKFG